tara:strand:+ start:212 stop:952 length:741 start_codon:yes stop_codon:yes gene_type:complete
MNNTAIIIPTRLGAKRFPNKPLAKINNLEMIIHVLNKAKESKVGEVYVATPDKEIETIVKQNGGMAILTKDAHKTGSDRIYEVYSAVLKNSVDLIINLQGDMPNIKSNSILKLERLMRSNKCDIGTLASHLKQKEINDKNVVKVSVEKKLEENSFIKAKDFTRELGRDYNLKDMYHHIGIYAFTNVALTKYVKLSRSKIEIERNLEQWRAMENDMIVKVGLSDSTPLSVDTEQDLEKLKDEMEKNG